MRFSKSVKLISLAGSGRHLSPCQGMASACPTPGSVGMHRALPREQVSEIHRGLRAYNLRREGLRLSRRNVIDNKGKQFDE